VPHSDWLLANRNLSIVTKIEQKRKLALLSSFFFCFFFCFAFQSLNYFISEAQLALAKLPEIFSALHQIYLGSELRTATKLGVTQFDLNEVDNLSSLQ